MIKLKQLLLCEEIDEDDLLIISTNQNVSVSYKPVGEFRASTVSIDNTGRGFWWVSRSLVGNEKLRGQGIGSTLLKRAVQEVLKHEPRARIVVEPSGTYGSNEQRQLNFYRKNGFIDVSNQKGVLIYNNPKLSADELHKKLLESKPETFYWKSPKDAPAEVIKVIHIIIEQLRKKKINPDGYFTIYKETHPVIGLCWVIEQINDPKGGLVYSVREKKWFPFEGSGFEPKT
jgi:predicted N-acetyltransferase YhbS